LVTPPWELLEALFGDLELDSEWTYPGHLDESDFSEPLVLKFTPE